MVGGQRQQQQNDKNMSHIDMPIYRKIDWTRQNIEKLAAK
jgi:hypothetical protein